MTKAAKFSSRQAPSLNRSAGQTRPATVYNWPQYSVERKADRKTVDASIPLPFSRAGSRVTRFSAPWRPCNANSRIRHEQGPLLQSPV